MKGFLREKHGGAVFSASVIVPVFASLILAAMQLAGVNEEVQRYGAHLGSQLSFAIVLVGFFALTRVAPRQVGVRLCRPRYFLLALLIQFGILFALSDLNSLFIRLLEKLFGYQPTPTELPSMDGWKVLPVLFVVAVLPCLCEELVFRGVLISATRSLGGVFCVLVNGALFALMHENPAQTAYQFACGCAFALIAYRSGSVLPTVLAHFLNNAVVLLLLRQGIEEIAAPWYLTVLSAICLAFGVLWLIFGEPRSKGEPVPGKRREFFLFAAPGLLIAGLVWILGLFL